MTNANVTTSTNARVATPINVLGLKEYDLVKTVGKGIGIVLRKKSLNDELVIYSMSSATGRHRNDDDGMAKVRRYRADGTVPSTSETTGRRLRNRDKYTILGVASYANPVLAMKDFINQNPNIVFDPIVVHTNDDALDTANGLVDNDANVPAVDVTDMSAAFAEMIALLRDMNAKLDNI